MGKRSRIGSGKRCSLNRHAYTADRDCRELPNALAGMGWRATWLDIYAKFTTMTGVRRKE